MAGRPLSRSGKSHRTVAQQLRSVAPSTSRSEHPRAPQAAVPGRGNWRRRLPQSPPAACDESDPLARDAALARVEAVLFLAREPLNTRKLAQLANLDDGTSARTLVRRLNQLYDEGGSAFVAEEVAGGYQLLSRPKFAGWLRRIYGGTSELRLSAPALETLAVVAYRQPVLRAQIEAVRGVDCGEILRQLMERNLVRAAGRADELGRPYLYTTTRRFLQVFGLKHLDDLPRAELLRRPPDNAPRPADLPPTSSRASEIDHES
jgi:segregation and condensation protein B